jgi:hypothetical protein
MSLTILGDGLSYLLGDELDDGLGDGLVVCYRDGLGDGYFF